MTTVTNYTDSEIERMALEFCSGLSKQEYRYHYFDPEGYTPFGDE